MRRTAMLTIACLGLLFSLPGDALARTDAERDLCTPPAVLRTLTGEERAEALALETGAERRRAEYERIYRPHDTSPEATAAFRGLEVEWKELLRRVKDTDLETYCTARCSEIYNYRGEPEKGNALVAELRERRAAQRREREQKVAAISPELDALIRLMSKSWREKVKREEIVAAVAELPDRAAAVELIIEHFYRPGRLTYRHRAVRALEALGSEKARQALLDTALGRGPDINTRPHAGPAARAYVSTASNKSDARKLLASEADSVVWIGLDGLRGSSVDEALLGKLGSYLRSDHLSLRLISARVLTEDSTTAHAAKKVRLALESLATARDVKEPDRIWWPGSLTHAEGLHHALVDCLSKMRGVDKVLRDATPQLKGVTRTCVLIARAQRGDATVKRELTRDITNPELGIVRAWAVRTFETIGSAEDLPMLRRLAKSDPLQRKQGGCLEPDKLIFPVRRAAAQAVRHVEQRTGRKR